MKRIILIATALWNHGPQMAEAMKAQGVERPALSADEEAKALWGGKRGT